MSPVQEMAATSVVDKHLDGFASWSCPGLVRTAQGLGASRTLALDRVAWAGSSPKGYLVR